MPESVENPYLVLGLERGATREALRQAYFNLVRAHPPEREPEVFKRVRAAYEKLRDPEQRAELDMLLPVRWFSPVRQRRALKMDLTLKKEDVFAAAESLSDLDRTDWKSYHRKVSL
jgi:curved DNA-binding protein CbpA